MSQAVTAASVALALELARAGISLTLEVVVRAKLLNSHVMFAEISLIQESKYESYVI